MSVFTRSKIATTVENICQVTSQRTLVNDAIQIALDRIYQAHDWPYYMQETAVQTKADYTIGTIAINNASQTGTITTGVVSSTWVGRKVRVGNEKPYYKITSVNTVANTITIEFPYQGTSTTSSAYAVFKDEYRLASDVDKYKMLRQIENGIPMWSLTPTKFDERFPTPQSYADPLYDMNIGTKLDTYSSSTATLTIVVGSLNTITGSGTTFTTVEGLGRMTKVRIVGNVYTVKSVDSDTQLTIYETGVTVSATTNWEITLNNLVIQLYQIPSDDRLIYYRYFRVPTPLVNDYDIPDMPHEFHHILIHGALSIMWQHKGDMNNHQLSSAEFDRGMADMKMKLGSFAPDRVIVRKSTDVASRRRRFDGLEAANFDRKYSA